MIGDSNVKVLFYRSEECCREDALDTSSVQRKYLEPAIELCRNRQMLNSGRPPKTEREPRRAVSPSRYVT